MHPRPRDFIGYGQKPPHPHWPQNAKIAVNFVVNYEEGSEASILDGDESSENYLSEIANMTTVKNKRSFFSESIFEYGSRAGIWHYMVVCQAVQGELKQLNVLLTM